MDNSKKKFVRFCIIEIVFISLVFILYLCNFSKQKVYKEIIINNVGIDGSFIATTDEINQIGIENIDINYYDKVAKTPVSLNISLLDSKGREIWQGTTKDSFIESNRYTNLFADCFNEKGLYPIKLIIGNKYRLCCSVTGNNMQELRNLSVVLYGEQHYFTKLMSILVIVFLSMALLTLLFAYWGRIRNKRVNLFACLCLLCITEVMQTPNFTIEGEEQDFARSYYVSNIMMGLKPTDNRGYVYVEYQGIRDAGVGDKQSLYRFWNSDLYGESRDYYGTSSLYKIEDKNWSAVSYCLPALGQTVARELNMSYRIVFLLGRCMNILLFLAAFLFLLVQVDMSTDGLVYLMLFVPGVISSATSYSYISPLISICLFFFIFYYKTLKENGNDKQWVNIIICTMLIIVIGLINPIMSLFGLLFLLNGRNEHRKINSFFAFMSILTGSVIVISRIIKYGLVSVFPMCNNSASHCIYYVINTLFISIDSYFMDIIGERYYGEIYISAIVIFPILFIYLYYVWLEYVANPETKRNKYVISLLMLLFFVLTIGISQLHTSQNNNGTYFVGVNGIYFLPMFFVFSMYTCINNNANNITISSEKQNKLALTLIILTIVSSVFKYDALLEYGLPLK